MCNCAAHFRSSNRLDQPPSGSSYNDGRDAVAYADGLMRAVEQFMDEMLSAFELHVPARFQATSSAGKMQWAARPRSGARTEPPGPPTRPFDL